MKTNHAYCCRHLFLTLAGLMAASAWAGGAPRTDFGVGDLYTLAPDGSRHPVTAAKDGFALIARETPVHLELKDIEPGEYHISVRARFAIPEAHIENFIRFSEVYVNGRRTQYIRATIPEEGDGAEWLEHDKVQLKNGDVITLTGRFDETVSAVRLTKGRLAGDVVRRYDEPSSRETYVAELEGSALRPDGLTVALANKTGRPQEGTLSVRVTDYWGREVFARDEALTLAGALDRSWTFAANATGETRATVVWKQADGLFARKYLSATHDVLSGLRKRLVFETGWSWCARYDDGSYDSRRVRDDVPANAQWKPTSLPALLQKNAKGQRVSTAYFRNTLTLPDAFRSSRVIFSAERARTRARLFVNGTFVRAATDEELGLPFEADMTDALKPGANEILLVIHGYPAAFRDEDLRTQKNLDRSLEYLPTRSPVALCEVQVLGLPATRLTKTPVITTKLDGRTLKVETRAVPALCTVSHRVLRKGREVVKPFRDGETVAWPDVELWGPTEFPLYELETTLSRTAEKSDNPQIDKSNNSLVLDRLSTRFGFREFSARGVDLLWNGMPYRGLSRAMGGFNCLDREANGSRQRILDGLNLMQLGGERFITHTDAPHILYDFCDELGMPAKCQSGYIPAGQMESRFLDNDHYWEMKKANARLTVDIYGRHPSIFVWPVSGEFWTLNDDRAFKFMAPCIRDLQAYDPTRSAEAESDADCRGLTKISSTHYPMSGSSRAPEMWYPNQFYFRPLDVAFTNGMAIPCGQDKSIGNCHGDGLLAYGTKPIFANETGWVVNIGRPHHTTRFFGEEGYQGFNTLEAHHVAVNRETYHGQRDMGMTHVGDWRALGHDRVEDVLPLFDVQPVERFHAFYEGTPVSFQVNVAHDIPVRETLDFTWELAPVAGGPRASVAEGAEKLVFDGCKGAKTRIAFAAPAEGRYTLRFGVKGRLVRELPIESYARRGDEAALLKDARIVAGDRPVTAEMLADVAAGGALFLLPRANYPEELPVRLQMTQRNASLLTTFRAGHPLLKGLAESDLSLWYPNHVCGFGLFNKPTSGLVKTVVEAGGPSGFAYSALVEIPYGKGIVYATRLELKPEVNPVAAKLLRNVRGALGAHARTTAARRLGVIGGTYLKTLRAWGVDFEQVDAKALADGTRKVSEFAAFLVDGRDKAAAAFFAKPSTSALIMVQDPDPKLWNVKVNRKLPKRFNGSAIKLAKEPKFLSGLTNTDFFWRKRALGWAGENPGAVSDKTLMLDPLGTAEIWGEDPLLYPRFLAARGNILFSALNLAPSNIASRPLAERIVTTIFANAGVTVSPRRPVVLPKRFRYETVDISKLLHRPFADDVDNDGKGGWGDLGPNQDLREFKLPAGVHTLAGVDYRIERPNSIFVMRSSYRKPGDTYLDATVELGGKKAPWIFFLHSCVWEMALQVMSIYVDYTDGSTYEIVMSGGANIRDYAAKQPDRPFIGELDTVTKCAVTVPQVKWGKGSMFSTGWCNPRPEKPIARLRFHSLNRSLILFAAVTLGYPLAEAAGAQPAETVDKALCDKLAAEAAKLQSAKKYREAIALYEKAHAADPRQLYVMNAIGNCYDRLEDYAHACEWYQKSLDTDINQPHVLVYLNAAKAKGGIE